ncbi:MAG: hypothetical protein R6W70_02040 [bacterium]
MSKKCFNFMVFTFLIVIPVFLHANVPIIGDLTSKAQEFVNEFKELGYVTATGAMVGGVIAVVMQKKIGWAMIIAGFIGNMALYRISDIADFAR